MKKIYFLFFVTFISCRSYCQIAMDFSEMYEQISAIYGYIVTAEKGYQIAEKGWNTIKEIKNGEFNLHSAFFNSLNTVNPKLTEMAQVAEIISNAIYIKKQISSQLAYLKNNPLMHSEEITYISQTYSVIAGKTAEAIDELTMVLTDGTLEMDDGLRMERIQAIYHDMNDQYGLVNGLSDHANLLLLQKQDESKSDSEVGSLYGISGN
jgi:hypothetical protein